MTSDAFRPAPPARTSSRADWIATADRLLDSLRPFRSASGAYIPIPGPASWSGRRSDGLEGFARSFLLASLRIAGTAGEAPDGLLSRYRQGLVAGTDPGYPEAWPPITDRGQPLVEAASIALALHWTRPWLWETLDEREQRRVIDWLAPSATVATPDNNWVLFPVVVQEFLAGVGGAHEPSAITRGLERIERWYQGNGWYRDGDGQNFDYYNAWALHLYPLLWTLLHEVRDPAAARQRQEVYSARLAQFLPQHLLFFGRDGSPVFQGRSLSYRFAALSPFWLGELFGLDVLDSGVVRNLAGRTLDFFLRGGALDERGLLTSGWLGEFRPMIQVYSGPASPYWASKGFLGLLLPPDAPVWTSPEAQPPTEFQDVVADLSEPGFLLSRTGADGITRLVNHGSDHYPPLTGIDDPHYARFGYSSRTAPSFEDDPVDNHIGVLDEQGRSSRRAAIERLPAAAGVAASAHVPVWPAGDPSGSTLRNSTFRIVTASVVSGPHAVHVHLVTSKLAVERELRIGGWAVAGASPPTAELGSQTALGRSDGLVSRLRLVHGDGVAGVHRAADTSPLAGHVLVPTIRCRHRGRRTVWAVVATLTEQAGVADPVVTVRDDGAQVQVTVVFETGSSSFTVSA